MASHGQTYQEAADLLPCTCCAKNCAKEGHLQYQGLYSSVWCRLTPVVAELLWKQYTLFVDAFRYLIYFPRCLGLPIEKESSKLHGAGLFNGQNCPASLGLVDDQH